MKGLSKLENSFGSLARELKKTLVEGFNTNTITGVSHGTETTLTLGMGHGFVKDQVVVLPGGKEAKVLKATEDTITIAKTEVTTGEIKAATLGFSIVHSEGNTVIFKSKKHYLKVVDEPPYPEYDNRYMKYARAYASPLFDGKDLVSAPFVCWDYITDDRTSSGHEEDYRLENRQPVDWYLIGDEYTFYLIVDSMGGNIRHSIYSFGSNSEGMLTLVGSQRPPITKSFKPNTGNRYGAVWNCAITDTRFTAGCFIASDKGGYPINTQFRPVSYYLPREQFKDMPSWAKVTSYVRGKLLAFKVNIEIQGGRPGGYLRGLHHVYSLQLPTNSRVGSLMAVSTHTRYTDSHGIVTLYIDLNNWEPPNENT